jgi:hypothetical protein
MLEERSTQIVELCARVTDLSEANKALQEEADQAHNDRSESAEQLLKGNASLGRLQVQVEELGEELAVWEQRCYKAEVRPTSLLGAEGESCQGGSIPRASVFCHADCIEFEILM